MILQSPFIAICRKGESKMNNEMKRGLMTQFPCARGRTFVCKNIGDYVQSVASRQYS